MPEITILYFAGVAERLGIHAEKLVLPDITTVDAIIRELGQRHPPIIGLLATCRLAVDQQFASGTVELHPNSELAIIPPVSGG
jgi:molybdopterin converting factor subunit 1